MTCPGLKKLKKTAKIAVLGGFGALAPAPSPQGPAQGLKMDSDCSYFLANTLGRSWGWADTWFGRPPPKMAKVTFFLSFGHPALACSPQGCAQGLKTTVIAAAFLPTISAGLNWGELARGLA